MGNNAPASKLPILRIGRAYEASAYIIDGYGASLAKKYDVSLSNRTWGIEINVDTGGVDLTGDTYVGPIRGRTVIGTTQANASIMGVLGQIDVGASVNIQGNFFGVDAVLDFYGASTAGSGASFHAGCFRGTLWNEGTTTVGAIGVLAGINLCQNSGKPTLGTDAVNPAVYVRSQASCQWATGVLVSAGSTLVGIQVGDSLSSTAATGHHLTATSGHAVLVYADDNAATLGADVEGMHVRAICLANQNAAYSMTSIRGQLKFIAGYSPTSSKAAYGVLGGMEGTGTQTFGANAVVAGVGASISIANSPTFTAGSIMCGVHVNGRFPAAFTGSGEAIGVYFQAIEYGFEHAFGWAQANDCGMEASVNDLAFAHTTHRIKIWNAGTTMYIPVMTTFATS